MPGPLDGVRAVELAAIGPAPFAGMLLADLGAEVIHVARASGTSDVPGSGAAHRVLLRGRRVIHVDLKHPAGADVVRDLAAGADVFLEGFRPGVAERLGVGPDELLAVNSRLVYGRMTGWGQDGPRAGEAGHDLGYLALSGALAPCVGDGGRPVAPLNMLGDFGGGAMLLVIGVVSALFAAQQSGEGQVVDAAVLDGAALLTAMHQGMLAGGLWEAPPGGNLFDGGAPFYRVYRTADDRWLSVAAIEPKFYAALLDGLGLPIDPAGQHDRTRWPALRDTFAARIATRARDEWVDLFAGTDACVVPVLEPEEAASDPHLAERGVYVDTGVIRHPAPAPRFSATPTELPTESAVDETAAVLGECGYTASDIRRLADAGVIATSRE
ncbi:CaiB/BaiF CoA transferase family protein [Flexivirga caeni]|uniref:CoA transferase n=1 Tax=Flexivirga caeni TaxID=2294115 RepID=A0A3M9ME56_9MICO|nr:CaiB/BaiF CoA-transferase family protein [Flexivirga caeni]RNI23851.1 CoA transferase [Flexivirga caeni]